MGDVVAKDGSKRHLVAVWDRPQLHNVLEQLREGDVLVVWKLDRLSRMFIQMLGSFAELERSIVRAVRGMDRIKT